MIRIGRRNKKYRKTLKEQAHERLVSMQAFGTSKRDSVENNAGEDKIFSFSTYRSYWKHTKYWLQWMSVFHPEVTTLDKARPFVREWLEYRERQEDEKGNRLSAWTLHLETSALCKLFQITVNDPDRYHPPKRERKNIRRSRVSVVRDRNFSATNNDELIKFCKGTGLRRAGLLSIRGRDLYTREQIDNELVRIKTVPVGQRSADDRKWFSILQDTQAFYNPRPLHFVRVTEKGGRTRLAPIVGSQEAQIVARFLERKPEERVWEYVNSNMDIHGYRADYARSIYRMYARPIEELEQETDISRLYICRKDEAGRRLDRQAVLRVSKALGHNRAEVAVNNYLRGL